jgi:hypothetical protein
VILDDLLKDVYSRQVCDLFTKGSHCRNIRMILITQNLFHQGRYCRDISLNAEYLVLLKNVQDKNEFTHLARQVYPENSTSLDESYLDATREPHGYIILDFSQDTHDLLRFRTHVFPEDRFRVVYAPVEDETREIELSRPQCANDGLTQIAQSDLLELRQGTVEKYKRVRAKRTER